MCANHCLYFCSINTFVNVALSQFNLVQKLTDFQIKLALTNHKRVLQSVARTKSLTGVTAATTVAQPCTSPNWPNYGRKTAEEKAKTNARSSLSSTTDTSCYDYLITYSFYEKVRDDSSGEKNYDYCYYYSHVLFLTICHSKDPTSGKFSFVFHSINLGRKLQLAVTVN